jgi:hypothetical protein
MFMPERNALCSWAEGVLSCGACFGSATGDHCAGLKLLRSLRGDDIVLSWRGDGACVGLGKLSGGRAFSEALVMWLVLDKPAAVVVQVGSMAGADARTLQVGLLGDTWGAGKVLLGISAASIGQLMPEACPICLRLSCVPSAPVDGLG